MKAQRFLIPLLLAVSLSVLGACDAPPPPETARTSVELRTVQSRVFETGDRNRTMRAVIATLQDLGYAIDQVDPAAGTVTATKLSALRITVSVAPRGDNRMVVRANARVGGEVDDPAFYQRYFFEPLAKSMFLDAHQFADES